MVEERLDLLMKEAITNKATDIHFSFTSQQSDISMRTLHGLKPTVPREADYALYQYLKFLSKLDLAASMKPQSGTFSIVVNDYLWHCRFSAIETFFSQNGVLRILNLSKIESLSDISSDTKNIEIIQSLFSNQHGLLLFSGITGSGKSTTMFSGLKDIKGKSIYTLEDPVECLYPNIMQIQINEQTSLDFEAGIKQLLRHDPDIIVIGEIRSPQEAKAAIRCALSGHLVCATIHAASANQTVTRLLDFECTKDELKQVNLNIVYQNLIIADSKRSAQLEILQEKEIVKTF